MTETTSGDSLNVRLAKKLGYTERDVQLFSKTNPEDTITIRRWFDPTGRQIQRTPDFEGDLNAVWSAVPDEDGWSLEVWTTPDETPAALIRRLSTVFYGRNATSHTQAAALALEALLDGQQPTADTGGAT